MLTIKFKPGVTFFRSSARNIFRIVMGTNYVELPFDWVRSHTDKPPTLTFGSMVRFSEKNDRLRFTAFGHTENMQKAWVESVVDAATGAPVWPTPPDPNKNRGRGFKFL